LSNFKLKQRAGRARVKQTPRARHYRIRERKLEFDRDGSRTAGAHHQKQQVSTPLGGTGYVILCQARIKELRFM
jgi:hypothetical protein